MKFKLSTLLWLVTLVAVITGCWLWVKNERDATARKIRDSEADLANMKTSFDRYVATEMANSSYFRNELGIIQNLASLKNSHIKLVRLPDELGGKLYSGLPFLWQWRMLLVEPNEFELCWAIHDIPKGLSFDIPAQHIHRSHLNIVAGRSPFLNPPEEIPESFLGEKSLEVIVYFRIDGDSESGSIQIDYEINEPREIRKFGKIIGRGDKIQLSSKEVQWLSGCRSARGGYGTLSGKGIEHGYGHLPLLNQSFSLEDPLTLVKIRSERLVGINKYEPFEGPCPGLLVWIQKKSGPSTDMPKYIIIKDGG